MIKAVLIDFDDTLCLTEEATYYIENTIAQEMGHPPMTREAHQKNWGVIMHKAIPERFPGIDVDMFLKKFEKALPGFLESKKLDVISDINYQTLQTIKKHGLKTAIVTSRDLWEVKHLLDENHELSSYIDAFYHKDNSLHHKPDPRVFIKPLQELDIKPHEAVYIGDTIGDAESAKGAGMHFIALLESGLKTKKDFDGHVVDFFAERFPDILQYLKLTD